MSEHVTTLVSKAAVLSREQFAKMIAPGNDGVLVCPDCKGPGFALRVERARGVLRCICVDCGGGAVSIAIAANTNSTEGI